MTNQKIRQESKFNERSDEYNAVAENNSCPRCGGEMVTTSRGVVASFPSPALERLVCSGSNCSYVRYVKLDSNGFSVKSEMNGRKGEQSA